MVLRNVGHEVADRFASRYGWPARARMVAVSLELCSEAICKFTDVYAFVMREGYIAGLALC